MNFVFALLMNVATAVTPGVPVETPPVVAAPAGKAEGTEDCDGATKPKTVEILTADPKIAEQKAIEEKALQNLGLKKDEVKKPANVISGAGEAMETCK